MLLKKYAKQEQFFVIEKEQRSFSNIRFSGSDFSSTENEKIKKAKKNIKDRIEVLKTRISRLREEEKPSSDDSPADSNETPQTKSREEIEKKALDGILEMSEKDESFRKSDHFKDYSKLNADKESLWIDSIFGANPAKTMQNYENEKKGNTIKGKAAKIGDTLLRPARAAAGMAAEFKKTLNSWSEERKTKSEESKKEDIKAQLERAQKINGDKGISLRRLAKNTEKINDKHAFNIANAEKGLKMLANNSRVYGKDVYLGDEVVTNKNRVLLTIEKQTRINFDGFTNTALKAFNIEKTIDPRQNEIETQREKAYEALAEKGVSSQDLRMAFGKYHKLISKMERKISEMSEEKFNKQFVAKTLFDEFYKEVENDIDVTPKARNIIQKAIDMICDALGINRVRKEATSLANLSAKSGFEAANTELTKFTDKAKEASSKGLDVKTKTSPSA